MPDLYREAFLAGLAPEPELGIADWADQYRILPQKSSAEPGPWRTDRTPYLRDIMDCLSPSSPIERVVFMKGSQLGGSECGNNFLGYIMHKAPGPTLMVQPTVETAKRYSRQRLAPMIEFCAPLRTLVKEPRERDSGNTVQSKEFPGGIIILTGANSAAGLRSMPVRYLFLDEIDAYPLDVEGEGDPTIIAEKRTSTFARRKIVEISTPTIKGLSRIERRFEESDQRRYFVPCPLCQGMQWLRWAGIVFEHHDPTTAVYRCEHCLETFPEHHKTWMLANGEWRAQQPEPGRAAGFHLSALYSPLGWKSWAQIVDEFLKAKGNPTLRKTWVNTVLGETWEEDGETIDHTGLLGRREGYGPKVPLGACVLTAGVDPQDNRVEVEVVAWGKGEESWGLVYRIFYGSPAQMDVWTQVDDFLKATYEHENGVQLRVACACIDTGGHHTKEAYAFIKPRQVRRIHGVKGSSQPGDPLVGRPTRSNLGKVALFPLGVDTAKEAIYGRLKIVELGPGFMHFPLTYDQEYFEQLTAEKIVTQYHKGFPKRTWVKMRARNEALDCRVYALAALAILNPNLERLWENLQRKAEQASAVAAMVPSEPRDPVPTTSFMNTSIQRKGGFVGGWKG